MYLLAFTHLGSSGRTGWLSLSKIMAVSLVGGTTMTRLPLGDTLAEAVRVDAGGGPFGGRRLAAEVVPVGVLLLFPLAFFPFLDLRYLSSLAFCLSLAACDFSRMMAT